MAGVGGLGRVLLALAIAGGFGGEAWAQAGPTKIDAQIYRPALDGNGIFSVETAQMLPRHAFTLRLASDYAAAPLEIDSVPVFRMNGPNEEIVEDKSVDTIIDSTVTINLGFAFGIFDWLTVGLDLPVMIQSLGDGYGEKGEPILPGGTPRPGTGAYSSRPSSNIPPSDRPVGDLRVGLKARLFKPMALQLVAWVPFGDEDVFAGSAGFTFEPRLIYDVVSGGSFRLTLNAGARLREGNLFYTHRTSSDGTLVTDAEMPVPVTSPDEIVKIPRLFVGSEIMASLGAAYDATPRLAIGADVHALIPLAKAADGECEGDCKNGDMTAEVVAGGSYAISGGFGVYLGVGAGVLSSAARSPTFRVLAGLTWSPTGEGAAKVEARGDRDADGIPDAVDLCADEPEDNDGFQDDDGCPELDNDLDGVLDAQDNCKDEPEDRDGHQDEDGCSDPDNDGDQVADLNDRCPNEPEDLDGFDDDDGCPDEDNDGDGFVDAKDTQCPNEPETLNGYQDDDGCPDVSPKGGPQLAATEIDMQGERVEFVGRTANLTKPSEKILDLVFAVIRGVDGVAFRIEVHVESSGPSAAAKKKDQQLSDDRADAIYRYLVAKGIPQGRLSVAGFGASRPIDRDVKNARNRRVQFIRVQQQ